MVDVDGIVAVNATVGGRGVSVSLFVELNVSAVLVNVKGIDEVGIEEVFVIGEVATVNGGDKNENQSCPEIKPVNIAATIVRQVNTRPKADNTKVIVDLVC